MDVEFELEGEAGRRQAHRERIRGLWARIAGHAHDFVVHDVSATGLALIDHDMCLKCGATCRLALVIAGRPRLTDLTATVVREAEPGQELAGMTFEHLEARQEVWLDKLVLEIQKRRIDLRKARAAADNPEDKKTDRVTT